MAIKKWWNTDSKEIYWLESTDREDLGTNLHAPKFNDAGQDYWSYSLILETRPGDIVFHYHKPSKAIVARSVVAGVPRSSEIIWGARGTYARKKGTEPHPRPGWLVDLREFSMLSTPLTLEEMRRRIVDLADTRSEVIDRFGNPTYFPFEISTKRPLRMHQGYAFKLPGEVVRQFNELHQGALRTGTAGTLPTGRIGSPYLAPDEKIKTSKRDPFEVDPDIVDRGLRGHAATQNALANFLIAHGIEPLSPNPGEPSFDIAWSCNEVLWVAEIKSTTRENEEKQLRLGLGQVLRYRQQLQQISPIVNAVLAVEHQPIDKMWIDLCSQVGVLLVWPDSLQNLLSVAVRNRE